MAQPFNMIVKVKNALHSLARRRAFSYPKDMYYVYILENENQPGQYYKGFTTDLKRRMKEHDQGTNFSTSRSEWVLVFYSAFPDKMKALEFEKYLKSASGIAFMRKRLIS